MLTASRTPVIMSSSSSKSPPSSTKERSRSRSKTPTRTPSFRKPKASSPTSSEDPSSSDRDLDNRIKKTPKMRKFKGGSAPIPTGRPMSTPALPKIVLSEDGSSPPSRVQSSADSEITVPKPDEDSALEKFFKPTMSSPPNKKAISGDQDCSSITLDDLDLDFLKTSPDSILSVPKKGVRMQKRNHRYIRNVKNR